MNRLEIDTARCKACGLCIEVCPKKILCLSTELNSRGYHPAAISDQKKCIACALCALVCPECAIAVFKSKEPGLKKTGD